MPATCNRPPRMLASVRRSLAGTLVVATVMAADGRVVQGQRPGEFVLPRPSQRTIPRDGAPFVLSSPVRIVVARDNARLREIGVLLADAVRARTGFVVTVTAGDVDAAPAGSITLDTTGRATAIAGGDVIAAESYALDVSAAGVKVHGATSAAVLWGVQTLRQLLPPAFEETAGARPRAWPIAAVQLADGPRYAWRGSMLDAARHFLPVADVKRHIDLLSRYKLNVLHWHLTDDQGWRIEIRGHPRLTSVGAWRTEATGERTGGFYTQREVRDVVEYARRRGVLVVPEIEMPGHSSAALAAYPQLGCTGAPVQVQASWGVFADIYCAGNEDVFTFLFSVLDEVMALFPSPFIHVGGDEVPKERWRDCTRCQEVMRREGLTDEEQLQGWFLRRIGSHLAARGRTLIAWDEALEGGVLPGGIVQVWRDSAFTRKAVARGHRVIASPSDWTYLNRSAGELTLEHVQAFAPRPAGLDSAERALVLGSELTFWSEHITSGTNLDLMALPRLLAFSDVLWGATPRDDAGVRVAIAREHDTRLAAMGRSVGASDRALPRMRIAYDTATRQAKLHLTDTLTGLVVRATTDGTRPGARSRIVADGAPLGVRGSVRLQTFIREAPILEERRVTMRQHLAVGAHARVVPAPSATYPGTGTQSLSDGLLGSDDHGDGLWTGWWGPDVEVVIDLGADQRVGRVTMRFLQNMRSWIILPSRVGLSWSADGTRWSDPVERGHDIAPSREGAIIETFDLTLPTPSRVRYLRMVAHNAGPLPAGQPGAGQPSWLFADEVIVLPPAARARR